MNTLQREALEEEVTAAQAYHRHCEIAVLLGHMTVPQRSTAAVYLQDARDELKAYNETHLERHSYDGFPSIVSLPGQEGEKIQKMDGDATRANVEEFLKIKGISLRLWLELGEARELHDDALRECWLMLASMLYPVDAA